MEFQGGHDTYPECAHIPKAVSEDISEGQALKLPRAKGENVLPLFERKVSDYKRIKLCSLQTNEVLKCRWKSYVSNIDELKRTPFRFPNNSDLHFCNCGVKFMPSLTPANRGNCRMQMVLGPGVDQYGQIPIPSDMHVTKSVARGKIKPVGSFKKARNLFL